MNVYTFRSQTALLCFERKTIEIPTLDLNSGSPKALIKSLSYFF